MVALMRASTLVFASSNVTTASAFSRLTSALLTPATLRSDLCTETTQPLQVIPVTESVTVSMAADAAAGISASSATTIVVRYLFIVFTSSSRAGDGRS